MMKTFVLFIFLFFSFFKHNLTEYTQPNRPLGGSRLGGYSHKFDYWPLPSCRTLTCFVCSQINSAVRSSLVIHGREERPAERFRGQFECDRCRAGSPWIFSRRKLKKFVHIIVLYRLRIQKYFSWVTSGAMQQYKDPLIRCSPLSDVVLYQICSFVLNAVPYLTQSHIRCSPISDSDKNFIVQ